MYRYFIKPGGDFIVSLILLIIFFPIILITAVFLLVTNNGEIFFIQKRPGLYNKPFKIVKFKTMKDAFDIEGNPLPDNLRITKIGSFIRATSLDELLQFVNVLKGDMSLVGPRPLLMQYLKRYNEEQAKRHNVKPGITGWAQVNGRNAISWQKKFMYDIEYVERLSFLFDLRILWMTLIKVIQRRGITAEGQVTMGEFMGNN